MTVFVCENFPDGIFTGVYDAWASRLGHANVALRIGGSANLELFAEYRTVKADGEKARKVADTIRRKMGEESYEMIYQASLASLPERADCIYRVLAVGLSSHTDPRTAHHLLEKLQDANVCRVFELSRKVWHEAHRYMGFVRFRELGNGVLFSEIEAENQILWLIGDHFADRYPNEYFMIYDHHSRDCLLHAAGKPWFLWRGAGDGPALAKVRAREEFLLSSPEGFPGGEEEIQRLWKNFCRSISIHERENLRLQTQFWPLKFRKWMTES